MRLIGRTGRRPAFVIVGIDGASFDLVDRFIDSGRLPNLAALQGRAASARMACTWPAHTAPGWASLVSGRLPGRHGIFQFFDTQQPDYGATIVGSRAFGCSTIWDWLAVQAWTLGVVNVPMSHPPRPLPGYQVTWPLENTLRYSSPRSLLGELARGNAHFQSDLTTMYRGNLDYIDEAVASVGARVASFAYLLRNHPVDAVMMVFTEVDRVCHHYWHFFDPSHPRHEAAPAGLAGAIERIHVAIDDALGVLLDMIPDDTPVVVVSDHGSGPGHHVFAVHRLLEQAGLLATRPSAGPGAGGVASWFSDGDREIDWSRTSVYLPVPGSSGLNVNLRGRQRDGIVPASQRARLLEQVRTLLLAQTAPDGTPAFEAVIERDEAFAGPMCERAPDLLLMPRSETMLVTPALGGPLWQASPQTGLHRHTGLWMHASPRIAPGRLRAPIRIVDVVPTLLADVGAAFPASLDGRPIVQAFAAPPEIAAPLDLDEGRFALPPFVASREDQITSARLRDMGYL